jgi:hypothetical protein
MSEVYPFSVSADEFAGKRVLVTGGTKGIGAAIVRRFQLSGALVATTARSAPPSLDSSTLFVKADTGNAEGGVASPVLMDSYEAERRPVAEMITQSGDRTELAQTVADAAEREGRNQAIRARLADPKTRHDEVVAAAELNRDYSHSPIVAGDANGVLPTGRCLPDTIPVLRPDGQPGRLHESIHHDRHTLVLLGGLAVNVPAFADLHATLKKTVASSFLFDESIAFGSHADLPDHIGRLEPGADDLLGVDGITLLVIRPDGYIGLRSDRGHLEALEAYRRRICAGST